MGHLGKLICLHDNTTVPICAGTRDFSVPVVVQGRLMLSFLHLVHPWHLKIIVLRGKYQGTFLWKRR